MNDFTSGVPKAMLDPRREEIIHERNFAERPLVPTKVQGAGVVGCDRLSSQLAKNVPETVLDAELTEHPGHERGQTTRSANMRAGTRLKTVVTETPSGRDREPAGSNGSFEPVIVLEHKRRLDEIDQIVFSLFVCGLTSGEAAAHFEGVYDAAVHRSTISRITEKVAGEPPKRPSRPLGSYYPWFSLSPASQEVSSSIMVKVQGGEVRNTSSYTVVGITVNGERAILDGRAGDGGENAMFCLRVGSELKICITQDVPIAVCDGFRGLPEATETT